MLLSRFLVRIVSASLIVLSIGAVSGQDYPNKPIRIVTSGIGGASDFAARLIAHGISGSLGQLVVVENRGGTVSGETVAKAPPDGYTLLVTGSVLWTGPLLRKTPYDPVTDFLPITLTNRQPNILVVHPSLPVKSVKELIALARARPRELNYASSSIGGGTHIAGESFKYMAGVNIVRVGYKTDAQEISDLLSGEVQLSFGAVSSIMPYVKTGKLRALAVTSADPTPLAPGLPTVAATVPGYEAVARTSMFAPAKTPTALINRLNQEVVRILRQPDVKQKFFDAGVETVGSSPEALAAAMKSEMIRLSKLLNDVGIKAE